MSRIRATWTGAGLALALVTGFPAVADDVELLLTVPGASNAAKPNVLFILDSSGSMTTVVETNQEPFDGSKTYSGDCNRTDYYWSTSGGVPNCDSSTDRRRRVDDAYFVCKQGRDQIAANGSYSGTLAQYLTVGGKSKWQELASSQNQAYTECADDSGIHGDGTANLVYAQIGTNRARYTSNASREVDWGSSPTNRIYTVYSGNYLNWYANPPSSKMTRNDIVKAVTKNVLGSINNVNVGFMRFNGNDGGMVYHAIKDLDTTRTTAMALVDALPASGNTPLAETMYEAALYWRGMQAHYGPLLLTDTDGLDSKDPMIYRQPTEYACAKNFIVYLTDGEPTQDYDADDLVENLPNWTTTLGSSGCTGGTGLGVCLDDIAEYLSKEDVNPDVPGDQTVSTYTIGFTVDLPILAETARKSGGKYYLAEDVKSLTVALTDIVTNIFDRDISFTAPAVAVNAFNRTQHLNDLYVSVFRAANKVHWPGNIKKYTIADAQIVDKYTNPAVDPSTGYFSDTSHNFWNGGSNSDGANVAIGGAANLIPDPATRNVYTNLGAANLTAASNAISSANELAFTLDDFGLAGDPGDPDVATMLDWIRGYDVRDEDGDPTTTSRKTMGDALHAQPASIVYGMTGDEPDVVVFTSTNDGFLHAIDGSTGVELWSYMPHELLANTGELYFDEAVDYKNYGLDGDIVPVVADRDKDGEIDVGTDFVYLIFGMRRGGDNYYALDVTDRNVPKLKWVRKVPQIGQSWSPPVPARVNVQSLNVSSPDKVVLIIGGGYDTVHDQAIHPASADVEGAGVFMLDLETGAQIWRAGPDAAADLPLTKMTRAIPARIRVLDLNGDGFADRMYAADLGGQIWRFDIRNGLTAANLVAGGVIARFGAEGISNPSAAVTRRFYTSPDVSLFHDHKQDRRFLAISLGSGYRAHPLDGSAEDRFYSLRDRDVFTSLTQLQYNNYDIATDSDLVEVSGTFNVDISSSDRGWKLTLPVGEKVLSDSQTFADSVFFVSFEPTVGSDDPCQAGLSVNRLYRVNVANGDPVVALDTLDPNDAAGIDASRVTELEQGGIAPKPSFLFPSPTDPNCTGEECSPPPIGCVGVECFDPGFANNPVRTLWTQDGIE
ncbi:MAG TPA: PilC/PilY family type IV pilus protein [Woeseiaceae bacterium]|nr:PilC/PilY family type IV pilus protein [Woeseiaceae bacterium]